jgi:hypothetical protein
MNSKDFKIWKKKKKVERVLLAKCFFGKYIAMISRIHSKIFLLGRRALKMTFKVQSFLQGFVTLVYFLTKKWKNKWKAAPYGQNFPDLISQFSRGLCKALKATCYSRRPHTRPKSKYMQRIFPCQIILFLDGKSSEICTSRCALRTFSVSKNNIIWQELFFLYI